MSDPALAEAARHLRGLAEWMDETRADLGAAIPARAPAQPQPPPAEPPPQALAEARAQSQAPVQPPAAPAAQPAVQVPTAPPAERLQALRDGTIGACTRCKLHQGRQNIVFGVGDPAARIMFVGEGPGANEDRLGAPFVGRAGELLDRIISAMGLARGDVYIANIVKCRPPGNRDPEPEEVEQCEPFLKEQIRIIEPEALVALGRVAATTLLNVDRPLGRLRGRWHQYEGIPLRATYHPAALLRNAGLKRPCWEDVQTVMERLGLERPPRGG